MTIEWDKILSKPSKQYKVPGEKLLEFRQKIERLSHDKNKIDNEIIDLNKQKNTLESKITTLEEKVKSLESQLTEKDTTISTLNEKMSTLESDLNETIKTLESELNAKGTKITTLEEKIKTLESELNEKNSSLSEKITEIENLQNQLSEKEATLNKVQQESTELTNQQNTMITNLKNEIASKNELLEKKDQEIENLTEKIDNLNKEIEELKEKIPKKPVYEKADEVVKGAGCPKCGWTTIEEYKYVDGKRQLIRKYCPNTFCMWTSTEGAGIKIETTEEEPVEEDLSLKLFKIVHGELEPISSISSDLAVIIADPAQNIVWVWKGTNASRFEYAAATRLAFDVKNNILKNPTAHILRVNEGEEPDNFPQLD
ncbi:MAG: hypothetical protein ACTSRS_12040 [Candidatus Helarchaeota archaeon]